MPTTKETVQHTPYEAWLDEQIETFNTLCYRIPGFEARWDGDAWAWMEATGREYVEADEPEAMACQRSTVGMAA